MDVINYGAIKNLDKKLGMSLGEVGSNFGMTSGQFLVNFDGFDEVNSIASVKTFNGLTTHNGSTTIGDLGIIMPYFVDTDDYLYGISLGLSAFIKMDVDTEEVTIIKNIVNIDTFLAAVKSSITSSTVVFPGFGQNKIILVTTLDEQNFVVKVINMTNETIETHNYTITSSSFFTAKRNLVFDYVNGFIYVPWHYKPTNIQSVGVYKINTTTWTYETITVTTPDTSADTTLNLHDVFVDIEDNVMYISYNETVSNYRYARIIRANLAALTSVMRTIAVTGCTLNSGTTSENYYRDLKFIGKFEDYIYLAFQHSSLTYPYSATTMRAYVLDLKLNTAIPDFHILEFTTKEPISYANIGTSQPLNGYAPNGRNKVQIERNGNEILLSYSSDGDSTYQAYNAVRIIDTAAKTVKTKLSSGFFHGSSLAVPFYLLKVLKWTNAVITVVSSTSFSIGYAYYAVGKQNDTTWHIETNGETLMIISKQAYTGTSFLIEIDGKQYKKTIPACGSSAPIERQVLIHSKTGVKLRALESVSIEEIFWGVIASA